MHAGSATPWASTHPCLPPWPARLHRGVAASRRLLTRPPPRAAPPLPAARFRGLPARPRLPPTSGPCLRRMRSAAAPTWWRRRRQVVLGVKAVRAYLEPLTSHRPPAAPAWPRAHQPWAAAAPSSTNTTTTTTATPATALQRTWRRGSTPRPLRTLLLLQRPAQTQRRRPWRLLLPLRGRCRRHGATRAAGGSCCSCRTSPSPEMTLRHPHPRPHLAGRRRPPPPSTAAAATARPNPKP